MRRVRFEIHDVSTNSLYAWSKDSDQASREARLVAIARPGEKYEIRRVEVLGHFVCPKPEPQWIPEPDEPAPASPTAHEEPAPDTASEARSRLEEQFRTAGDAQIAACVLWKPQAEGND